MRMNRKVLCWSVLACVVAVPLLAESHSEQKAPQMSEEEMKMMAAWEAAAKPGEPHQHLAATAGKWDADVTVWMKPGDEPMKSKGTSQREMTMGGRILVDSFKGTMMGQPFTGHGMIGYDNVLGKYWSTWNDDMSTGIMLSWGECDEKTHSCTFTGDMVDPMTKQKMTVRQVVRHEGPDKEVFEMYQPHEGKEYKMMEIVYTRAK